jgi:mRNA interferase RelE/StbE
VTWQVLIHPLVSRDDLPRLDPAVQKRILKIIRKKLTADPENYGKPLRGDLAGYWKLKIEDYRVIYTIKRERILVKVIQVGARRDFEVYEALVKRIPKILE